MLDDKTVDLFNIAFKAMEKRANELGIKGNAVVAYLKDKKGIDWKLSTQVCGNIQYPQTPDDIGWNLIGMSCSKASESIITRKASGDKTRTFMHGEVGFQGAEFKELNDSCIVAAFGGGADEQDFEVGKAGIKAMEYELKR